MIDKTKEKRRHERHPLARDVRIEINGETIIGETRDISLSGVAIDGINTLGNDQFVQMHIENIGDMSGHVVRRFDDGFAVEFDPIEEERLRLEAKLKAMFAGDTKPEETPDETERERRLLEKEFKTMFEGNGEDQS